MRGRVTEQAHAQLGAVKAVAVERDALRKQVGALRNDMANMQVLYAVALCVCAWLLLCRQGSLADNGGVCVYVPPDC